MTSRTAAPAFSPELRAAIYHFTVFGTAGVASVYFGIWLTSRGVHPDQIGIINAAPVLLMLAVNVIVGRLADRARDWRSVIIILSLIGGVIPIGLYFVSEFWGIFVYTMILVIYNAHNIIAQWLGSPFATVSNYTPISFDTFRNQQYCYIEQLLGTRDVAKLKDDQEGTTLTYIGSDGLSNRKK